MKYIRGSVVEWFSSNGFIEVGGVESNRQLGFSMLVKLFSFSYDKTVVPWKTGMRS